MVDVFRKVPTGTLVYMGSVGGLGEYEFEVWFPYTRDLVRMIKKGTFVAIKNFDSRQGNEKYSLLQILEAVPTHFALGGSKEALGRAYPGQVIEASKNLRLDWEQEEPTESTTQIKCTAISSERELRFTSREPEIKPESAFPMPGEDAFVLENEMVTRVVNEGLVDSGKLAIAPASLTLDEDIPLYIGVEDLLRTHFGAFGFTRAGKSNLVSTLASRLLDSGGDGSLVFFDIMGEYTGLLADKVHSLNNAFIVALDPGSVVGGQSTLDYFSGSRSADYAAEKIVGTMLLPPALEEVRQRYTPLMKDLLEQGKIRIMRTAKIVASALIEEYDRLVGTQSTDRKLIKQRLEHLLPTPHADVSDEALETVKQDIESVLAHKKVPLDPEKWGKAPTINRFPSAFTTKDLRDLIETAIPELRDFKKFIEELTEREEVGKGGVILRNEILMLLDEPKPILLIFQSDRSDQLKHEAARIMTDKYHYRRIRGQRTPQISFIFDEADEFIPTVPPDESTQRVKGVAETIARRGAKFGLGVGIATQRSTYLDTSIMGQPHTYLISKLPRKVDRDRVAEAFGLSESTMEKTLGLKLGEWIVISHEATGMPGIPIPARFHDANERIKEYLKKFHR